jgi:hypothetical protein
VTVLITLGTRAYCNVSLFRIVEDFNIIRLQWFFFIITIYLDKSIFFVNYFASATYRHKVKKFLHISTGIIQVPPAGSFILRVRTHILERLRFSLKSKETSPLFLFSICCYYFSKKYKRTIFVLASTDDTSWRGYSHRRNEHLSYYCYDWLSWLLTTCWCESFKSWLINN